MIRCPRCGTELPDGVSFCDHCGAPVRGQMPQANPVFQPFDNQAAGASTANDVFPTSASASVCPVCGAAVIPGEAFCDNCGASLLAAPIGAASAAAPPVYPTSQPAPPVYQQPAPAYQPPVQPPVYQAPPQPVVTAPPVNAAPAVARFVVVSTRAELPLPNRDDMVVGREDPQSNSYPDVDLNPHGALEQGVSRRQARITRRGAQYYVEDLNSTNGTLVNQRRIAARQPTALHDNDQIMFGRLGLIFEQH